MKIIFPKENEPAGQADPYILKAEGKYYIYATSIQGVHLYESDSLFEGWKYLGYALQEAGAHEFWAPCVIEKDGTYYMYYSSFDIHCDDVHQQAIKVATADSPRGPFEYKKTILAPFSIDPHVVQNESGYYIFYSINDYDSVRAGTYIVVDKLIDMFTPEGKPVAVVRPTLDEEVFMRDRFKKGQNWHTIEGAFYFRKGDDHYVMYSGNCYQNEYYFVGYAYAHSSENDLRKIKFEKQPSPDVYAPLLCKNDKEEGTGHNSVLEENGKYYVVYHARDIGDKDRPVDARTARVCEMHVDGKTLTLDRD